MERFGTEYGGFYYPSDLDGLNKNSIIYCIGAGEDISHDIAVSHKTGASIFIMDPTPRAKEHVDLVKKVLKGTQAPVHSKRFGGSRS